MLNNLIRSRINIKNVMESKILSFSPSKPLNEVIEIMRNRAFSQIPIIQGIQILGTVTESSIISKSHSKEVSALTVNDVMVDALPILPTDTRNEEIYTLLKYHPAILVVSKGMLLGIITKTDIMHHLL